MVIAQFSNAKNNGEPLVINPNLLQAYREQGDICLVNIKRELTRALVDYKLFQQLQQINNSFFVIIDYMETERYTYIKEVEDDKHRLVTALQTFIKDCKSAIATEIYNSIYEACKELSLIMNKLVQIIKIVNEGENCFGNVKL